MWKLRTALRCRRVASQKVDYTTWGANTKRIGRAWQMPDDDRAILIPPCSDMRDEFVAYAREFRAAGEPYAHGELAEAETDFAAYVERRRDWAAGRNVPDGLVPWDDFWLVRDGRILARSRLRHRLNDALLTWGGHIGYEVRPSERRKGLGSRLLAMTLDKARKRGLSRVLVTCDPDNAGSRRIIEKNGGVFEDERISPKDGRPRRRYWLNLTGKSERRP